MFLEILTFLIIIIAFIFLIGQIIYLFFLIFTPSKKLSTDNYGKKNIIFKLFKKKCN